MLSGEKKIYFVSDAHLGARFHENSLAIERKLVRWLDSIAPSAAAVWFLGDIFDYWFEYRYVVPKGFVRFLGKVAQLADSGVEIHFFTGNHDVWMFDYLPQEIGVVVHHQPLVADLYGKRFYLSHGDEADNRKFSFRLLRKLFRNRFCQWLYAGIHPRWSSGFALNWSLSSRRKGLETDEYQGEDAEYLVLFAKAYLKENPGIDFFLFGHRHIVLDLMLSHTTRILISGDWMKSFSYIQWDGTNLSLEFFEPGMP